MSLRWNRWRGAAYFLLLAVTATLVVVWWPELTRIWREHFTTFVFITLMMILSIFVQSQNFLSFLPSAKVPRLVDMAHTWAVGALVNYLGPFQPGLAVRTAILAKLGIPVGESSVATLRQVVASMWMALALASISLMWIGSSVMVVVLAIGLLLLCAAIPKLLPALRYLVLRFMPSKVSTNFRQSAQIAFEPPSARAMVGILVQYALATLVFFVGYRQFGVDITVPAAIGLACVVYASSLVALLPGNLGVLEALCTGFGQANGLAVEQALALAFLYRGASLTSVLLIAAIPAHKRSRQQ
jgi:uncharacterized membrane protein YbhN (UPF0104 family)